MKNKILYFPYINIPQSDWLTRMLLYWDEVGAIVPNDFIEEPEHLDPHMCSLVQTELVRQFVPRLYIHNIPRFKDSFLEYLNSIGSKIDYRRKQFKQNSTVRIHIEKMDEIGPALEKMKLAVSEDYPWYNVESQTGKEFMGYLAACLGKLDVCDSIPITDSPGYINEIIYSSMPEEMGAERSIAPVRLEILENIFPSPNEPLFSNQIEDFKNKHGKLLVTFRNNVESKITQICSITQPDIKQRSLELNINDLWEGVKEIREAMASVGWSNIVFGKISSVVAAIPGASSVFGLINAAYGALRDSDNNHENSPLLYAAYAQEELLDPKRVIYESKKMSENPILLENLFQNDFSL